MTLYQATGDIVFRYLDVDLGNAAVDSGASATIGVQDATGQNGVQYAFNGSTALRNNLSLRLTPVSNPRPLDVSPGPVSSNSRELTALNQTLYFVVDNTAGKAELWRADQGSISAISAFNQTGGGLYPSRLSAWGDALLISATDASGKREIWRYDAQSGALQQITHFGNAGLDLGADPVVVGSRAYFLADDGVHGKEIWSYDGANVTPVRSGISGLAWSLPANLAAVDGSLYFSALSTSSGGRELWRYDGSTMRVIDVPSASGPTEIAGLHGTVYFVMADAQKGAELWRYDGQTVAPITEIAAGAASSSPAELTVAGDALYFRADDGTGAELYRLTVGNQQVGQSSAPLKYDFGSKPVASAGPDQRVAEGSTATFTAAFADPSTLNGSNVSYAWEVRDADQHTLLTSAGTTLAFTPVDDGTYEVRLTVIDHNDGDRQYSAMSSLFVYNVAPGATSSDPLPDRRIGEGGTLKIDNPFRDPGTADTLSYRWELTAPDGATSLGTESSFQFLPPNDGTYRLRLRVTDDDGAFASDEMSIVVDNEAPQILLPSQLQYDEGTAVQLHGIVQDAGRNDNVQTSWSVVGAGSGVLIASGTGGDAAFSLLDNGDFVLQVTSRDDHVTVSRDIPIAVRNVAPLGLSIVAPDDAVEGTQLIFNATYADPGLDSHVYAWTVSQAGETLLTSADATLLFTPPNDGSYTVALQVSDDDGGTAVATPYTLIVSDVAPSIRQLSGPQSASEGQAVQFQADVTDPGTDTVSLTWQAVAPNGDVLSTGTGALFNFTLGNDGAYRVVLTTNDGQATARAETQLLAVNAAPQTTAIGADAYVVPEGTPIALLAQATDVAGDAVQYSWRITSSDGTALPILTGAHVTFTPSDDGVYTAELTVTDGLDADVQSLELTALNVSPQGLEAGGPLTTMAGAAFARSLAPLSDPGADTVSVAVDYGDGVSSTLTPDGTGKRELAHVFAVAGSYTVTVTARDEDGGEVSDSFDVTVEPAPAVIIEQTPALPGATPDTAVAEGGASDSYTIRLARAPTAPVRVTLQGDPRLVIDAHGAPAGNALDFTPANWNIAQTVRVSALDDAIDQGDVSVVKIAHKVTSADTLYDGLGVGDVSVTVTDNDHAGVIVLADPGLQTTEDGGTATVRVRLASQPTSPVSIALLSTDLTEGKLSASRLSFDASNWNTLQTVTVAGQRDAVFDGPVSYDVVVAPAQSADTAYAGADGADIGVTNLDLAAQLYVSKFTPSSSGFRVEFNRAIDPRLLNLYASQATGAADLLVTGPSGPVSGSVLLDADNAGLTFVRSGGPLIAGQYTVTLFSRTDGFVDSSGKLLDGNADGSRGDNFTASFVVQPSAAIVVALPDLVRAPGQHAGGVASTEGLPISLSNGQGVSSLAFKLRFDPALFQLNDVTADAGLPQGSTVHWETTGSGVVQVTVTVNGNLAAGPVPNLLRLLGEVPSAATYTATGLLAIEDVLINGGLAPAIGDQAVQVVALIGDTSGNAQYSSLDVRRLGQAASTSTKGLQAWPLVDPIFVGDVTHDGLLDRADMERLLARVSGGSVPGLPPLPAGLEPLTFDGPTRKLEIARGISGRPGEIIRVPVLVDKLDGIESAVLRVAFDSQVLEFQSVRPAPGTPGFQWLVQNREPGAVTLDASGFSTGARVSPGMVNATAVSGALRGGGTLMELRFRILPGAQAGTQLIDLQRVVLNDGRLQTNPVGQVGADPSDGTVQINTVSASSGGSQPRAPLAQPAATNGTGATAVAVQTAPAPVVNWSKTSILGAVAAAAPAATQSPEPAWKTDFVTSMGLSDTESNPNSKTRVKVSQGGSSTASVRPASHWQAGFVSSLGRSEAQSNPKLTASLKAGEVIPTTSVLSSR